MKLYYYAEKGQQLGPFTLEELKTKKLKKTTLVWTEGMTDWLTADNVNELNEVVVPVPPPLPQKNIDIKSNLVEKIEIDSKFDLTYKKETYATTIGIVYFIVLCIMYYIYYANIRTQMLDVDNYGVVSSNSNELFLFHNAPLTTIVIILFLFRIYVYGLVFKIAKRQNRNSTKWAFYGWFFPIITLIVIGHKPKLKYQINIDQSATKIEQYKTLVKKAQSFLKENKEKESLQIYKYVFEHYQTNSLDAFVLAKLYFSNKEYKNAESIFTKIVDIKEYSDFVYYYLGVIAFKYNDFESAQNFLNKVTKQFEIGISSLSLLNTIRQNTLDNSSISELKTKYNLVNYIDNLGEFEIIEGFEVFNLTQSNQIKGSIQLYWNGLLFKYSKNNDLMKDHVYFVSFTLIDYFERIEKSMFKIKIKDMQAVLFNATNTYYEEITPKRIDMFLIKYKLAEEDFLH